MIKHLTRRSCWSP